MKTIVRAFALALVVTGIAAGAHARSATTTKVVFGQVVPYPTCPPNSGGCGVW